MKTRTKPSRRCLALLLLCAGASAATTAAAYDAAIYSNIMLDGMNTMNNGIIQSQMSRKMLEDDQRANERLSQKSSSRASASAGGASSGENFGYHPSSAVSREVQERILDLWRKSEPGFAATAQKQLAERNVRDRFEDNVGPYGLKATDVGDAMTAYWVIAWVIVQQKSLPSKSQVLAVRAQLQPQLEANSKLVAADDAKRQEMAETFIYEFMLINSQRLAAKNASQRGELATAVAQQMHKFGVPIENLKLTDAGFTRA